MARLTVTGARGTGSGRHNEKWCIAMMWWNHGWGWGDWLAMSLMMLAFWGLVIGLVVWLIRTTSSSSSRQDGRAAPAERLLDERFAAAKSMRSNIKSDYVSSGVRAPGNPRASTRPEPDGDASAHYPYRFRSASRTLGTGMRFPAGCGSRADLPRSANDLG